MEPREISKQDRKLNFAARKFFRSRQNLAQLSYSSCPPFSPTPTRLPDMYHCDLQRRACSKVHEHVLARSSEPSESCLPFYFLLEWSGSQSTIPSDWRQLCFIQLTVKWLLRLSSWRYPAMRSSSRTAHSVFRKRVEPSVKVNLVIERVAERFRGIVNLNR